MKKLPFKCKVCKSRLFWQDSKLNYNCFYCTPPQNNEHRVWKPSKKPIERVWWEYRELSKCCRSFSWRDSQGTWHCQRCDSYASILEVEMWGAPKMKESHVEVKLEKPKVIKRGVQIDIMSSIDEVR